ncbi:N-acetylmuramoyl-L-alanine amidase [Vibrio scophthalmi]|uniref:N-acetylmuramoyl-L-alanine amidase n=1 Tax=Vibrio scophthalmi TaxID=45658 RepID=UPI002FF39320
MPPTPTNHTPVPATSPHNSHSPLTTITVHCSATRAEQDIGASTLRAWHRAKGWRDIGYHFVVTRAGKVETGRPLSHIGAHVRGHNRGNIGICVVGGCDEQGGAQDNFTLAQRKALFALIERLQQAHGIADEQVKPHHAFANKACPVMVLHPVQSVSVVKQTNKETL